MTNSEFNIYRFKDREHWKLGLIDNFEPSDNGELAVKAGFVVDPIKGTDKEDVTSALDFDPCNYLHWVRKDTGVLVRLHEFGPQPVGVLSEAARAIKLSMGKERIWLLMPGGINSYAVKSLHSLRQIKSQRTLLDMTDDCCDGVWWLEGGDLLGAELYHADRYGCLVAKPISLSMPLTRATLSLSCCGRKIVILDYEVPESERTPDPCGKEKASWRLIILDCKNIQTSLIVDSVGTIDPDFEPQQMVLDSGNNIQLVGRKTVDPKTNWIWTLSLEGVLIARDELEMQAKSSLINGIAANGHIVLALTDGLVNLRPADMTGTQDNERESTFISPTLVSPDGTPHGWQRADVDVILPVGTTLKVKCAATRDAYLITRVNTIWADDSRLPQNKIDQINELSTNQQPFWREEDTRIYVGTDVQGGAMRLSFPLHQIDETNLWLSLTLYTPPGRKPPSIKGLTVYYPNFSYLRYLPAVYQENPASAKQLKGFLGIFETLFGDLDTEIGQLPDNIDPKFAPDSWLPFLLSWLGLPSPDTLKPRTLRRLLQDAPTLLAERGTEQALKQLLEILVADIDDSNQITIEIDDMANQPLPWILQPKERQAVSARLGLDTLIVAQQPPAFRLGQAWLGTSKGGIPLGIGHADLQQILAQRNGELKIKIISREDIRERIEPIIAIYLPYFVPAHCRYRLEFLSPPQEYWQQRLDVDLRLQDDKKFPLGRETVLGTFRLSETQTEEIILDRNARLDSGLHLN